MAGDKKTLKFLVALQTAEFKKGINSVKKQLKGLGTFIKSAFSVGSLALFGKAAVQAGKDFEDAMARVRAVSDASTGDFKAMNEEARKLGSTTIYSATEAANALEFLTRNGLSAKDATTALSHVLKLAQANAIDLATAADIVTNTLNMFGASVDEAGHFNDVLSTTAAHSATNVLELYDALVNAAPAAHVLGFSIEETSAAVGALANLGVKGANAGTALRMAFVKMSDPNITKKLQAHGVAIDEASMKADGLTGTLKKLYDAQLSFEDLVGIFSQKGAVGIQQLVNAYDQFNTMLGYTDNAVGTSTRMFEQGVGSVRKELDLLKNQFNNFLIGVGDKTSGMVKGVVRLLQNLVGNFKTFLGTILNLASVAVPLLVKSVIKLIQQTKVLFETIKKGGLAAKAAMANWISIIASLVTWIGTALYGAWNRVNGAMKEADKEMKKTQSKIAELNSEAEGLIKTLGPQTDEKTLEGVVMRLTEMFPDFAEAINAAAAKVRKDQGWDEFKQTLQDIVSLQANVMAMDANSKVQEAYTARLGHEMKKGGTVNPYKDYLKSEIKRRGFDLDTVYTAIAGAIVNSDKGRPQEAVDALTTYFKNTGIQISEGAIKALVESVKTSGFYDIAKSAQLRNKLIEAQSQTRKDKIDNLIGNNTPPANNGGGGDEELKGDLKAINDAIDDYINGEKGLRDMRDRGAISADEYKDKLNDLEDATLRTIVTTGNYLELLEKLARGDFNLDDLFAKVAVNSADEKMKDFFKAPDKTKERENLSKYDVGRKERDTLLDYAKSEADILGEEYKNAEDYADDLKSKITELEEAIKNGDFDGILAEALALLDKLNYALEQTLQETTDLGHTKVLAESIEKLQGQVDDLSKSAKGTVKDLAQAFERTYDSIVSVVEALGGEMDEDVKAAWEGFFAVINNGVQIFETFKTVMEAYKILDELITKKKELDAAKQVAANLAVASSEEIKAGASTAAAAAGAASSVAGIPFVGAALAVGAVAAVLAAILSSKNKFADGGIVGGNSFSGDNVLARVNSGEMVLNRGQQATLFNAINSGNLGGGGKVEFEIKADKLVGVLKNHNIIKRG